MVFVYNINGGFMTQKFDLAKEKYDRLLIIGDLSIHKKPLDLSCTCTKRSS